MLLYKKNMSWEYFSLQSKNKIMYCIQLFFTDDVIATISENTNKYKKFWCEQRRIVNPDYWGKNWEDVDVPCRKAYLGLSNYFGVLKHLQTEQSNK